MSTRCMPLAAGAVLVLLLTGCLSVDHRSPEPPSLKHVTIERDPVPVRGPASAPGVRQGSQRSWINIQVNTEGSGQPQQEPAIVIKPANPSIVLASAIDKRTPGTQHVGVYRSGDGGRTWTDGGLLNEASYPIQADPTFAYCADGSVNLALISTNTYVYSVFSYHSTDDGASWPTKGTVISSPTIAADKPWLACDASNSSYANRLYVSYMEGPQAPAQYKIAVRYSTNGGAAWSASKVVSDDATRHKNGSVVAVGPTGTVHVVWLDFDAGKLYADRSTNGAATFGTDVLVSPVTIVPAGTTYYNSLPALDVDRTTGTHRKNLYVAWSDLRNGDPDILFSRSTDGGATWSSPLRVNDDALGNGADQVYPAVVVDPKGRVVVTFLDKRRFPGTTRFDLWGAISRDGGVTFDTNFLVTDAVSDQSLRAFVGDYFEVAATTDVLMPVWGDTRSGDGDVDIYTDRFPNIFAYDEVRSVRFTGPDTLEWDTEDARFGENLFYDVVTGSVLDLLADTSFDRATCLANDVDAPPLADPRRPSPGDASYYLVRATGSGGVGSYGDATPGRPNARDRLNQVLSTCP